MKDNDIHDIESLIYVLNLEQAFSILFYSLKISIDSLYKKNWVQTQFLLFPIKKMQYQDVKPQ